ncbi:30S ribosomal protein S20 [Candidatus Aerophobetes bacterium]|uniref:Small ribosomal subunit protein bS20 n=1 Tax=Aerophobetes bacterium TaxID=2030807 RepID=A0A2A4YH98_UNCAE|nr:MAG: 30S ribosomal protein S20 [Candidatus Aerophobetes bacterium]
MAKEEKVAKKVKRPTAQKRMIQNEKKKEVNKVLKSRLRTAVRCFETSLKNKEAENVKTHLGEVFSLMDRGVKKGIYKRNKAARTKSKFAAKAAD